MKYLDKVSATPRIAPFTETFNFQSIGEFESKAKELASTFLPRLVDRRFHICMLRRAGKRNWLLLWVA